MSPPIPPPKEDPSSSEYPISPDSEGQSDGSPIIEASTENGMRLKMPNMYVDNGKCGLGDVSGVPGAYQFYGISDRPAAAIGIGVLSQYPFQVVDGFRIGGSDDRVFYRRQPQQGTKESADRSVSAASERRNKRMIKNRESAERSRARRQAYTSQLEVEVKHLKEENDKLKENLKKLHIATTTTLVKPGKKLRPTSSAAF